MNKTCSKAAKAGAKYEVPESPRNICMYQIPGIPRCSAWIEKKKQLKLKLNVFSALRWRKTNLLVSFNYALRLSRA